MHAPTFEATKKARFYSAFFLLVALLVAVLLVLLLVGLGGLLGRLLLLLLVLALGARVSRQRLLQNLEDLLIRDRLVRFELAQVQGRGAAQLGDAVLGDGY